ncbi:MAG: hypothetical protein KF683_00645 [Rubrivivax sp.]|nr:hypothetical protein [Rubrivivax sp.]
MKPTHLLHGLERRAWRKAVAWLERQLRQTWATQPWSALAQWPEALAAEDDTAALRDGRDAVDGRPPPRRAHGVADLRQMCWRG